MHRREVEAEADRGERRQADAGSQMAGAALLLERREADPDDRACDPGVLRRPGWSPAAIPKATGTIAETPAIGATTVIAPIAIPR